MAHHRKAIASGTACAIVDFHGAYTHTRLQTQEKFRTAGLSATVAAAIVRNAAWWLLGVVARIFPDFLMR
jgi:hypothetical protein